MNASQLMDSRRFCLLMDDLAGTWNKRRATDEDKEFRLQAVLDFIAGSSSGRTAAFEAVNLGSIPSPASTPTEPEPPAKTQDELCKEACANALRTQPGPDGVRWVAVPLELDVARLGGWIEANKPGVAVSENHSIGILTRTAGQEAWSIPFVG